MHLKRKVIHQGGRNTTHRVVSFVIRSEARTKGTKGVEIEPCVFVFHFNGERCTFIDDDAGEGYRSPDIGGPYLNAAETAPNQTLFRPIDFAAVTDRGGKKSPITLRLIGVNSARNSR